MHGPLQIQLRITAHFRGMEQQTAVNLQHLLRIRIYGKKNQL
jgi:hypothetical protein